MSDTTTAEDCYKAGYTASCFFAMRYEPRDFNPINLRAFSYNRCAIADTFNSNVTLRYSLSIYYGLAQALFRGCGAVYLYTNPGNHYKQLFYAEKLL